MHILGYSHLPHYGLVATGNQPDSIVAQSYRLPKSASANSSHCFAAMPEGKDGGCQVTLDDERIVVLGGADTYVAYTLQVWELNVRTNTWTRYPDMLYPKQHLGCGVIRDPENGSAKSIVTAGGLEYIHPNLEVLDSVEILDLATHVWRPGKLLGLP